MVSKRNQNEIYKDLNIVSNDIKRKYFSYVETWWIQGIKKKIFFTKIMVSEGRKRPSWYNKYTMGSWGRNGIHISCSMVSNKSNIFTRAIKNGRISSNLSYSRFDFWITKFRSTFVSQTFRWWNVQFKWAVKFQLSKYMMIKWEVNTIDIFVWEKLFILLLTELKFDWRFDLYHNL